MIESRSLLPRRAFVSRMSIGVAAFGATLGAGAAQAQSTSDSRYQPARHAQDDWYDQIPGNHRLFFDTTSAETVADAIQFGGNFFSANKNAYGLDATDLAVIVCLRHNSTPFGYNNAIWAKYGTQLSEKAKFTDPKTKEVPKTNYYTPAPVGTEPARGLTGLAKRGVQIAVCEVSSHGIAGTVARATGQKADDVFKEFGANLIANARFVSAGILSVNRAQEHGYSIA